MRNGKRLLAGILATMTVFTSIPVQAVDISVPSTLNADQVTYNTNFNITVIAQEYTDEYGADELNEYLDSTSLIDVVDNTEKHTQ